MVVGEATLWVDVWCESFQRFLVLRSSGALRCMYRLDDGMVWYGIRTVSLSRKVPNADVARCTMRSDYSFSPQVAVGWSRCIRVRRYVQNSAVAGPDKYM